MRRTGHIPVGYNRDVHNTKRKWREYGGFDVVEASGNGRTIAVPTNEPRELSAYKYTDTVNAKLTSRVGSSIGYPLATNKPSIDPISLEAKVLFSRTARILLVTESVGCIRELEFNEKLHFWEIRLSVSFRWIMISDYRSGKHRYQVQVYHAGCPNWHVHQ
jgi:hypothetical protein